jgi:hypothetical protein
MRTAELLFFSFFVALVFAGPRAAEQSSMVQVKRDEIGGVVSSAHGAEAGVWVIAETTDLPTRYIKEVVTDEQGRYLLPALPAATYTVWARGYGLACPSHKEWCGRLGDSSRAVDRWEGAWERIGVAVRAHFSEVHVEDAEIIKERCRSGGD